MKVQKTQQDSLSFAHPLVREWFLTKLGEPTEPQKMGWPAILAEEPTLISAPTGSGKTLAAFLVCIDKLVKQAAKGELKDETEVLYVSPLKALVNDIQKNLIQPLTEILALGKAQGLTLPEIRVAVRTGDTPMKERVSMLKKPPHILVTTPESLYILLTAEKSRALLTTKQTIIIDEIHALADDKRGAHLALSLERLEALAIKKPIRIGLSATQKPLEVVASFLSGNHRPLPNIINIGHTRSLELAVEVPKMELGAVASNELWDEIYDRIAVLAEENRSTIIFANTRRIAERAAHHLADRLGPDKVIAHHGSLSREMRLTAETKLKNGELKALVATASLELGIDVGFVDLVCQLGSPRSIAATLQRVGRAGHWHGATSKGKLFPTTRDDLLECAALAQAIHEGDLDKLIIPTEPLDILSQQIVAACAASDWHEDDLYALVTRAFHYKHLSRERFDQLLEMLAEGIAGSRGRYSSYLYRDKVNGLVKGRRGARLTAITNGGAIPDNALFTVIDEPTGNMVGTLSEDFAVESHRDDIILLGSTSWRVRKIESSTGRILVEDAHGAPPNVPFWHGEAPGRTIELSEKLSQLRETIDRYLSKSSAEAIDWLQKNCFVSAYAATQIINYFLQGKAVLGSIPSQTNIIAERFFDEGGGMQLIIHAPFGARINKAWGLALRKCFCRSFNFELQAAATDNGINIALTEQHSFPLADVFAFLNQKTVTKTLTQAVLQSPLFGTRWRWDAGRSLALVRYRGGKKIPPHILKMLSNDLLAAVFPDVAACQDNLGGRDIELPDHPLTDEALKDCLTEALDLHGLIELLTKINNKDIRCIAVDTPLPSVFSHEILNANPYAYLDDAPLEERRARAVEMRQILPEALQKIGVLDADIIADTKDQAWPDIRNSDELQDTLHTLIALPANINIRKYPTTHWLPFFEELMNTNRAAIATVNSRSFWVSAEKIKTFMLIYPNATFNLTPPTIKEKIISEEEALTTLLRGWMLHLGPTTNRELSDLLALPSTTIEQILVRLEMTGLIIRGHYTAIDEQEWCERRLLARIHKLTLSKLRKEIEPVSTGQFVNWLLTWQHVAPHTQLNGEQGLLEILRQLQGFEMPARAWEKHIFAKRLTDYDPDLLDRLCLMGIVGWGRLSNQSEAKRIIPSSIAPITFFVRESAEWMGCLPSKNEEELTYLSPIAQQIYQHLKQYGASFFMEIVQGVNHLKTEVERGLWELVTAGLTTADGFDNLRSLIDPNRRLGKRGRRIIRHQYSTGRWSLLKRQNIASETSIESMCWLLLKRYGVVFRDLLAREKNLPRWRDLLIAFRRLEDRGEIRGGRFVKGFMGEQFALPYAIESLRASKKQEKHEEVITLSAVDPLNVVGFVLPGSRMPALSNKKIHFRQAPGEHALHVTSEKG